MENEDLLKLVKIFEYSFDSIVIEDIQGKILFWNKSSETLFGWKSYEVMGKNIIEACGDDFLSEEKTKEKLIQNRFWEGEYQIKNKSGEKLYIASRWCLIFDDQNKPFAVLKINQNINKYKELQEQLNQARDEAESIAKAKSLFLANMSHEIRTPMSGVIGMTELLLDTNLSELQREYADSVLISGRSLLKIINDILDFSKIEADKMLVEEISFNLREEISSALKTLGHTAHAKGIELVGFIHNDVPDCIFSDPVRLKQVVLNLLGNAIKFTDTGEVVLEIRKDNRVTNEDEKVQIHFYVRDTGVGIPQEKQRVIFDPFVQVDSSTTREFGGTGLGLAISSKLVKLMGGSIDLESEIGKGTTFHFTINCKVDYSKDLDNEKEFPAELIDLKILVIDDNITSREAIKEYLDSWGVNSKSVDSGFSGMVALEDSLNNIPYNIVIIDSYMPGMDGLNIAKIIKNHSQLRESKILMLLSTEKSNDIAFMKDIGVDAFLMKPVIQSDLRNSLLNLVIEKYKDEEKANLKIESVKVKSLRILLVEDNAVNQKLVFNMLEKIGHKVIVVNNGKEALVALDYKQFDVILMDIQMPVLDGVSATQKIRENEKATGHHIPIIAMTAHAMKGDREKYLASGMDDYISKPIDTEQLYSVLKRVVPHEVIPNYGGKVPVDIFAAIKKLDGDKKLLTELVEIIKNEYKIVLEELRESIKEKNFEKTKGTAHYLKTSLGSISAKDAYNLAYEIEKKSMENDFDWSCEIINKLESEIEDIINFFDTSNWKEFL